MENGKIPQHLREKLSDYLEQDPLAVQDLLRLGAEKMVAYQERLKRQRDGMASTALTMVAGLRTYKESIPPAWLLDFVWHQYPSGLEHRTVHDDNLRDVFLEGCKREPLDLNWIEMTRGSECVEWFKKHVQPKLG